jgi:hypothetical protein
MAAKVSQSQGSEKKCERRRKYQHRNKASVSGKHCPHTSADGEKQSHGWVVFDSLEDAQRRIATVMAKCGTIGKLRSTILAKHPSVNPRMPGLSGAALSIRERT